MPTTLASPRAVWARASPPKVSSPVWALRAFGNHGASRVYGPDTTVELLRAAQKSGIPIGFYGGDEATLAKLVQEAERQYQGIRIVFQTSPPFRKLTEAEDEAIVKQINDSGARWLFIGLGCPKQEAWMFSHRDRIPAVLLGVGAAFDFYAGTVPQAPTWMQQRGLEWAFRLSKEPRRLWRRYAPAVPLFVFLLGRQYVAQRLRVS